MQLPLLFLAPSLAAAAVPALFARACGDNCARAVVASAHTTRSGAADCSSYLRTTVTPATSTVIATVTLSFTPTATLSVTSTTQTTLTTVVPHVNTFSETVDVVTTTTVPYQVQRNKRQETSSPSDIPLYASACSGAARYTTACACVGVFPTTITASTPVTTQTVFVSVSETVTSTLTASTEVVVETATSVVEVSTTVTETIAATQTLVPNGTFRLRAPSGPYAGKFLQGRMGKDPGGTIDNIIYDLTADAEADGSIFTFNGYQLLAQTPQWGARPVSSLSGQSSVMLTYSADVTGFFPTLFQPMVCTMTLGLDLTCSESNDANYHVFRQIPNDDVYIENEAFAAANPDITFDRFQAVPIYV